jgi:hypothetical protein
MNPSGSGQKRENPFYRAFDLLLAKLLAADQAVNVSEAAFGHASESSEEWLERIPNEPLRYMLADICNNHNPGHMKLIPSMRVPDTESELLLLAIRNFRTQSYLWTIARAFEHFREFAESVERGLSQQEEAHPQRLSALVARLVSRKRKRVSRKIRVALKHIRKLAPSLKECETRNARSLHLPQWISVAEAVRDAVSHNEGVLRVDVYKRCSSSSLRKHFPGELENDTGYVLKPTPETVKETIRTFREYGVAIYKAVSDAFGFPATLLGPNGEVTTWRR